LVLTNFIVPSRLGVNIFLGHSLFGSFL
jgi:hypothetical protein